MCVTLSVHFIILGLMNSTSYEVLYHTSKVNMCFKESWAALVDAGLFNCFSVFIHALAMSLPWVLVLASAFIQPPSTSLGLHCECSTDWLPVMRFAALSAVVKVPDVSSCCSDACRTKSSSALVYYTRTATILLHCKIQNKSLVSDYEYCFNL